MEPHSASASRTPDDLSLTKREFALIGAFWVMYAILPFANRVFEAMTRSNGEATFQISWLIVPLADSLCWALLTGPIFWLVAQHGTERVSPGRKFVLFAGVGVVTIALVGLAGTLVRMHYMHEPPHRGPFRPKGPSPFWFVVFNVLVIYLGVLAAGFARAYSLRYQARQAHNVVLERQLAEARLDALQRQLDPHFLFNTLNAVASLVERDPRGVRKMISRLGALLRFSLEGANTPEIPLERELALLQQYLDIMQVRFQGRLEVTMISDPLALRALVPTLILQPLVENAIKHGIEPQRDGGRITIETQLRGDTVVLRVSDDGPGVLAQDAPADGGVGLRNTRARLSQLYGSRQQFVLSAGSERGAVAEVRLPFHSVSDV
ncbi:MAG: histidine kinase internal region [Gemmatimonadetes bacterium]|nr:histidine kinase internal region [Gemmatimonadota bacterium]